MRVVIEPKTQLPYQNKELSDDRYKQLLLFKCIEEIKKVMASGIFKHPTGALMNSINGYVVGEYIIIYSDKQYATAQEFGVKPHAMWYLLGKTVPIKIFNTFGGPPKTIYRKVTFEALSRGKWHHPGSPGKYFMKTGIDKAMSQATELRMKMISGGNVFI